MPQHNLTRQEAAARAAVIAVQSYEITLVLDGQGADFRSVTSILFSADVGADRTVADAAAQTFIDAIPSRIDSIMLNGQQLDPAELVAPGRITIPGLQADNELIIDGRFHYMNTGEGMHRFVDPVDEEVYLYTQFEVPDARRVFPVFEQPDLKASFSFTILAPEHWTVVSNSPTPQPVTAERMAESLGIDSTGLHVWQFAPTPRISSYITAIIAGPYASVESSLRSSDGEDVPLAIYCRESLRPHLDPERIFDVTRSGFAFFETMFGVPYPFEKYDQLFVPEFNAGAMENAGAVTIVEDYLFRSRPTQAIVERRAVTILHELAHMWFGDLVTMRWWNDLWLNESFAEYMSVLATAEATDFTEAWTTFATMEKSWAYRQDQLPSTHPIVAPIEDLADVEVNFDGITYAKGASVLKQLVSWVGREQFFAGLAQYFDKHAWSNTELQDLLIELEATSGRDLRTWSRLWLEESGVNLLRAHPSSDASGELTELTITQEPYIIEGQPVPSLRPHRVGVGLYRLDQVTGQFIRTAFHEVDIDGASTLVPLDAGTASPDVIVLNDADLTYAKVRFDPKSLTAALTRLSGFTDSLTQLMVLSTVWDMVRDGELPATTYLEALRTHLPSVQHSTGLLIQLRQLDTALNAYVPAVERAAQREQTAEALRTMYTQAQPGSDQQLQFFQAFVRHASTPAQFDILAELLDSGAQPAPGLEIDTDLRWSLIIALSAGGRLASSALEGWLADDDTAAGRRSAQTARFAPATSEAKTAAFTTLIEDRELPNAMVAATARGFALGLETGTGELIRPEDGSTTFTEEYFDRVAGWWETRTLEIAQLLTLSLYPPASADTVEATRRWLDTHPAAPKGLLRLMRENLDTAQRTLRCQELSAVQI